ncbi:MAG: hypothetical protein DRO11_03280 [Methanobacteriota archaeon]|nr:MAG: hypothetical protein DRO11_03280 [Euryarchaeota archaeon]
MIPPSCLKRGLVLVTVFLGLFGVIALQGYLARSFTPLLVLTVVFFAFLGYLVDLDVVDRFLWRRCREKIGEGEKLSYVC